LAISEIALDLLNGFDDTDVVNDGRLSSADAMVGFSALTESEFDAIDADNDGFLTRSKMMALADSGGRGCVMTSGKSLESIIGDLLLPLGLAVLVLVGGRANAFRE